MAPNGDAPGLSSRPLGHHVDLRPRRLHAHAEAGKLAVPVDGLPIGYRKRVDDTLGEDLPVRASNGWCPFGISVDGYVTGRQTVRSWHQCPRRPSPTNRAPSLVRHQPCDVFRGLRWLFRTEAQVQHPVRWRYSSMEDKSVVVSVERDDDPALLLRAPCHLLVGNSGRILRYRRYILSKLPKCPNAGQRHVLVRKQLQPVARWLTGRTNSSRVHSAANANNALSASWESCG